MGDTVDHLEAADQTVAFPEQDDPLQNVDEDTLRELNSVNVILPQALDDAQTIKGIATETIALKKRGLISALEAEQLAVQIPGVQGTEENPVSYTSVPTSVGLNSAIGAMQNHVVSEDQRIRGVAVDAIDAILSKSTTELDGLIKGLTSAITLHAAATCKVIETTGATPESNTTGYIGNVTSFDVLKNVASSYTPGQTDSPSLDKLLQFIEDNKNQYRRLEYYINTGCIRVREQSFNVSQIAQNQLVPIDNGNSVELKLGHLLMLGSKQQETGELFARAYKNTIDCLNVIRDHLTSKAATQEMFEQTVHHLGCAVQCSGILDELKSTLAIIIGNTVSTACFYNDYSVAGTQVPAQERFVPATSKVKRYLM